MYVMYHLIWNSSTATNCSSALLLRCVGVTTTTTDVHYVVKAAKPQVIYINKNSPICTDPGASPPYSSAVTTATPIWAKTRSIYFMKDNTMNIYQVVV
jgi:hypothetical protein